ncbi:uncharacterized ATP-dependent helicase Irc5p [[Candida] jaroonii]|uniref:Uncharacterized ATP-dependent helicase Irc5p n=1 Tax=[Candida] jaroonii TaxID=467808 RepID=A0ACA9Y5L7_9ASCO|nr:uncharacterized ATP-dependent helicase Irc5p [[Candida] jaroonii]
MSESRDASPETPDTSVIDDIDYTEAKEILKDDSEESREFEKLSNDSKMERLNNLIKKSQVYSQIIADQILENTKLKKEKRSQGNEEDEKKTKKRKKDVLTMLSKQTSEKQSKDDKIKQPKLMSGTLKDYQLDGLEWLITLFENGLNGILADEMGLGKTIQCIAFISFLIENGVPGPYLIVAPLSTISNWENEFKKFSPKLKVLRHTGTKEERLGLEIAGNDIVLTSFELSIKDFSKLSKTNWKFLIIDEGHRLKNMDCILIQVLKRLNVSNRLLITGTPLQNNLKELWSLLNFILPDIFHDLQLFQQWFNFDDLLSVGENKEMEMFIRKQLQSNLIKNLHTILSPFILRRLKRDVIRNLPPKKEYLIHIELSDYQKKMYNDTLDGKLFESICELYFKDYKKFNRVRSNNENALQERIDKEVRALSLRNTIMQLRQICNSPYIYYEPFPITENLTKGERSPRDKEGLFITELVNNSSKFKVLDQFLGGLKDNKILIFSQFTKCLDLISDFLTYRSIKHCRFDGSTSQEERDVQIKQFKDPKFKVFLLSTRSGGLGINLVEADTVILFDNDWNPQVDLQAIDRCHRIGQDKPVKIFRLLIKDSIEELLIMKNYSRRFLEKIVIRISNSISDFDNYEIEFNNLIEISKKIGINNREFKFDYDHIHDIELLNDEEMTELLDRSPECYQSKKKFDNISVFETLNKLDE